MARRWLLVATAVAGVLGSLTAACTGDSEPASQQTATLPTPAEPDTLLPVPDNTLAPDVTDTLPPDLLFGGNLCTALTAADIAAVPIAGSTGARLGEAISAADDQCQFDVLVGIRRVAITVKARSLADFVTPSQTGEPIDEIKGLSLAARGVQHADTYEVLVKVDNGFFAVIAPDRPTAEALAERAIPRAAAPAASASPPSTSPTPPPSNSEDVAP